MAKFFNTVLLTFLSFTATLCWVYYCTKLSALSVTISSLVAVATMIAVIAHKPNKKPSKNTDKFRWQMILDDSSSAVVNFLNYNNYTDANIEGNKIFVRKNNLRYCFFSHFSVADTTADDIVAAYKQAHKKADKLVVLVSTANQSAYKTAKAISQLLPTTIVDCNQLYMLFEQSRCLPVGNIPNPPKARPTLTYAFNKKRFLPYATASLFIFATGWLTFFPLYSFVWASVLAILALYSLFNKQFNKPLPSPID